MEIEGLQCNLKLQTLDLAVNKIKMIRNVAHLVDLEELWMNDNEVEDWDNLNQLSNNKKLNTIYLDHNPLAINTMYRTKVKLALPWLKQIDATLCK